MYLLPESVGVSKLDSRWSTGHCLGIRDESNELLIGTAQSVLKVGTIRYNNNISEMGPSELQWNCRPAVGASART